MFSFDATSSRGPPAVFVYNDAMSSRPVAVQQGLALVAVTDLHARKNEALRRRPASRAGGRIAVLTEKPMPVRWPMPVPTHVTQPAARDGATG